MRAPKAFLVKRTCAISEFSGLLPGLFGGGSQVITRWAQERVPGSLGGSRGRGWGGAGAEPAK